jgi:hypothetical protein
MSDKPITIELGSDDGAVVFRYTNTTEEIYLPAVISEGADASRFWTCFVAYAIQKEDWVEEFNQAVLGLEEIEEEQIEYHRQVVKDQEALERRSKFKIVTNDD